MSELMTGLALGAGLMLILGLAGIGAVTLVGAIKKGRK